MSDYSTGQFSTEIESLAEKELSGLSERERIVADELREIRDRQKAVRAVLNALRPRNKSSQSKPHKQSANGAAASKPFQASPDRYDAAWNWIEQQGQDAEITALDLAAAFPEWSSSYAALIVQQLRNEERLRLIRKGGPTGSTLYYRAVI